MSRVVYLRYKVVWLGFSLQLYYLSQYLKKEGFLLISSCAMLFLAVIRCVCLISDIFPQQKLSTELSACCKHEPSYYPNIHLGIWGAPRKIEEGVCGELLETPLSLP